MVDGKSDDDKLLRKWRKQKRDSDAQVAKYAEIHRAVQEVADHIRRQPRPR